jgi:SAM-dependent methyltransferase
MPSLLKCKCRKAVKHKILDSSWGIFKYLFLRNDYSWQLLTEKEKDIIRKANFSHNNVRPDYFDPEKYNNGISFDSDADRTKAPKDMFNHRGKYIQEFLEKHNPKSVLEFGPGNGYHTKQLIHYPSVESYFAVDVNKGFLDYLSPRLEKVARQKPFKYQLFTTGEFNPEKIKVDAVILLSIVHHDPERVELFKNIKQSLVTGGHILAIDPSHYLHRYKKLLRDSLFSGYLTKKYRVERNNLSTHHFCTLGEYQKICTCVKNLKIMNLEGFAHRLLVKKILFSVHILLGSRFSTYLTKFPLFRWLSTEIMVTLKKTG